VSFAEAGGFAVSLDAAAGVAPAQAGQLGRADPDRARLGPEGPARGRLQTRFGLAAVGHEPGGADGQAVPGILRQKNSQPSPAAHVVNGPAPHALLTMVALMGRFPCRLGNAR
jgi:hypothetical protein